MTAAPTGSIRVVLGLGTNLGDRFANLRRAIAEMEHGADVRLLRASRVYESEAIGPPQGPYLNAAVLLETTLDLRGLLDRALDVERSMGRVRRERWGPRIIDLDLLWAGALRVDEPGLRVPHPELLHRPFALIPLLEVLDEPPDELCRARAALPSLSPIGDLVLPELSR